MLVLQVNDLVTKMCSLVWYIISIHFKGEHFSEVLVRVNNSLVLIFVLELRSFQGSYGPFWDKQHSLRINIISVSTYDESLTYVNGATGL